MGFVDWILLLIALAVPPVLILPRQRMWLSCVSATIVFWAVVILGSTIKAAFAPEGTFGLIASMALGWIPAVVYVSCWYSLTVMLFDHDLPKPK